MTPSQPRDLTRKEFIVRVFIIAAVLGLLGGIWLLSDILLLAFGAVLFAVVLRMFAQPIASWLGLSDGLSVMIVALGILSIVIAAVGLFGPNLSQELRGVAERLPTAYANLASRYNLGSFTDLVSGSGSVSSLGTLASKVLAWGSTLVGVLASVVIVVFGGMYFAASPRLYLQGAMKLVPQSLETQVASALDDCNAALRRWLLGQFVAMTLVGLLTGAGLYLAGVPSAMALGLIAGLAEFIPVFGPFAALLPIVIMAASHDTQTLMAALAVFFVVQQVESNLITPLIADKTVAVPPALGLFAVVAMGVLFGPLGLLLGFPLVIVADILIKRLYILDTLGKPVEILGTVHHEAGNR